MVELCIFLPQSNLSIKTVSVLAKVNKLLASQANFLAGLEAYTFICDQISVALLIQTFLWTSHLDGKQDVIVTHILNCKQQVY